MKKILGLLMLLVSLHLYAEVSDVNVQKEEVTDVRSSSSYYTLVFEVR